MTGCVHMEFQNLQRAKYDLVHGRSADMAELAAVAGCSAKVLYNKTNPNNSIHHLTVDEAVKIQRHLGCLDLLQAEAAELNALVIPLGDFSQISDVELLTVYTQLVQRFGEHAEALREALDDNEVTETEAHGIHGRFQTMMRVGYELQSRVDAVAGLGADFRARRVSHAA